MQEGIIGNAVSLRLQTVILDEESIVGGLEILLANLNALSAAAIVKLVALDRLAGKMEISVLPPEQNLLFQTSVKSGERNEQDKAVSK